MKCGTHIATGALAGALYVTFMPIDPTMAIPTIMISAVGGMLPDIDHKSSMISKALIFPKYLPLKHRGITHSLPVTTIVMVINPALGIGYLSHILIDLLNKRKIKLFAPFSDKKYGLCICKSDGKLDEMIKAMSIIGTVILLLA